MRRKTTGRSVGRSSVKLGDCPAAAKSCFIVDAAWSQRAIEWNAGVWRARTVRMHPIYSADAALSPTTYAIQSTSITQTPLTSCSRCRGSVAVEQAVQQTLNDLYNPSPHGSVTVRSTLDLRSTPGRVPLSSACYHLNG